MRKLTGRFSSRVMVAKDRISEKKLKKKAQNKCTADKRTWMNSRVKVIRFPKGQKSNFDEVKIKGNITEKFQN